MKDRQQFLKYALLGVLLLAIAGLAVNPVNYVTYQKAPSIDKGFGGGGGHGFQSMPEWLREMYDAIQAMRDYLAAKAMGGGGGGGW